MQPGMVPGLQQHSYSSFDGARIAYQVRGPAGAPAIVLANGLGGTFEAFRHIYAALGERYRILCWDYRGLYRSALPTHDPHAVSVPVHCRDLAALLDHERVDRAVFIGWSMGVQVNFEFWREHRKRMAALVAINGTYGTPFRTAMASRAMRYVIPVALSVMKARAKLISRVSNRALAWQGLIPAMRKLGLVSEHIDADAMYDVANDFKTLDFAVYSDMLRHLGDHDARDLLPSIDVPTLIITGDKDLFTPVFTARKMNKKIAGSRLVVLEGASHYTPIEAPARIAEELLGFLGGVPGFGAVQARSATL